jgi:hypothetical protein
MAPSPRRTVISETGKALPIAVRLVRRSRYAPGGWVN